jgi:hypothetical protein
MFEARSLGIINMLYKECGLSSSMMHAKLYHRHHIGSKPDLIKRCQRSSALRKMVRCVMQRVKNSESGVKGQSYTFA